MSALTDLSVKIFADGADLAGISAMAKNPFIKGFTTNPTLMRKANVADYRAFALDVVRVVGDLPVSFEVFSDDFEEMEDQANEIARWGKNIYVKVPVTNTRGEFAGELIRRLSRQGVKLNVTALMTPGQVAQVADCLWPKTDACISVFAGRVADTGRDPVPLMKECVDLLAPYPKAELIWASPRELLNIVHADSIGCHIITVTNDLLAKLPLFGKDLLTYSLETVEMFRRDAVKAGFNIDLPQRSRL
ncbi:MAG: transaldolase [Elusimicrobia bacterium]|nr:transaldolase [Elusimicrobiota bacterium]